jgi:hypothetical protein
MSCFKRRPWWHAILGTEDPEDTSPPPNFVWEMSRNSKRYKDRRYENSLLNHLQHNSCLVSKKGLYFSLRKYCEKENNNDLWKIVPRTFYLASGALLPNQTKEDDRKEFIAFNRQLGVAHCSDSRENTLTCSAETHVGSVLTEVGDVKSHNTGDGIVWIMKPASYTNRGFGIRVVRGEQEVFDTIDRRAASAGKHDGSAKGSASVGTCSRIIAVGAAAASSSSSKKDSTTTAVSCSIGLGSANVDTAAVEEELVESNNSKLSKQARRIAAQDGWIVQQYMERPLLISGRKFDIRCYVLVTLDSRKGMQGYFYQDAYIRTSSKVYSMNNLADRETHLTNDAVQKHSKTYGKFEDGNKMDFVEWQAAIKRDYPDAPSDIVYGRIWPEIKRLSKLSLAAAEEHVVSTRINKSFEMFGYDYMIDSDFRPYLIEINTNPCLEFASPLLETIISELIENTIRIAVDPEFPPPLVGRTKATEEAIESIELGKQKFELIFP